jgi:hypothetical protein
MALKRLKAASEASTKSATQISAKTIFSARSIFRIHLFLNYFLRTRITIQAKKPTTEIRTIERAITPMT